MSRSRGLSCPLAALSTLLALGLALAPSVHAQTASQLGLPWMRRMSAVSGVEGLGPSESPALSADGRHVVFESAAANLVLGDANGARDVFARDRDPDGDGVLDEEAGTLVLLSKSSGGVQGNAVSTLAAISADGRHVLFSSAATNLVPADGNGRVDVFVHDRDPDGDGIFDEGNGVTTRLSVDSSETSRTPA